MKRKITLVFVLCLLLAFPIFAHDLFLKLDSFFVAVNQNISIKILNGSFMESLGAISFRRLRDVRVVSPSGKTSHPKASDLTKKDKMSILNLHTEEEGTYIVGLSTKTNEIDLKAKDFNGYLAEDGIPDILAERKRSKTLNMDVRERYSKHVKIIFQVDDKLSDNYKTVFGYPVEIIPRKNPYSLKVGETFEFLCLKEGKPLPNQFVMSGHEGQNGKLMIGKNIRTNEKGIGKIKLDGSGKWYLKFIQMTKLDDPKLNYESNWTTLTFSVR